MRDAFSLGLFRGCWKSSASGGLGVSSSPDHINCYFNNTIAPGINEPCADTLAPTFLARQIHSHSFSRCNGFQPFDMLVFVLVLLTLFLLIDSLSIFLSGVVRLQQ